jgi:hypothetical protein
VREKRDSFAGNLRGGAGRGNFNRGDFSGGAVIVRDGVSAYRLRLRLLSGTLTRRRKAGSGWNRERSLQYEHRGMEGAEGLAWAVADAVRDEKAEAGITFPGGA